MPKSKERQSNIEILRVLMAMGVIILHYNNRNVGGGFNYVTDAFSLGTLITLESVFICAVNVFVIISGYFLSKSDKRTIGKAIVLLVQVSIFRLGDYIVLIIIGDELFSFKSIFSCLLPVNWFIVCYAVMYLVSPLINKAIRGIDRKGKIFYLSLIICIFLCWTTAVDVLSRVTGNELLGLSPNGMYGSERGYTISNFFVCYLIGSLLRSVDLREIRIKGKIVKQFHLITAFVFSAAVIAIWGKVDEYTAWEYCNPLVVFEGTLLVVIFLRMNIGCNRFINKLSGATFSVYLLHCYFLKYAMIDKYASQGTIVMIAHLFLTVIVIFSTCFTIDCIYKFATNKLIKPIEKLWRIEY